MYDAADFENFYTTHLASSSDQLRKAAKRVDSWHLVDGLARLGLLAVAFGLAYESFSGNTAGWLFGLLIAVFVVARFKRESQNSKLADDIKSTVISKIIDHLCPGVQYHPDSFIDEKEYKASSLFRHYFDHYDGGDLVQGIIDTVPFRCSDLFTTFDLGKGQAQVFRGLFFSAKINPRFDGCTYIWPWDRVQLPASIMDEEYRLDPMPHVADIKTGDSEFENYYRVCSNNPTQAQEILSEKMMDNMLRLAKGIGRHIAFSFVKGRCYVAITFNKDILEPTDYDPGDKAEMKIYYDTVSLIPIVIKRLELSKLQ